MRNDLGGAAYGNALSFETLVVSSLRLTVIPLFSTTDTNFVINTLYDIFD